MKHFLDLGAHKLEGLQEFTIKLGIDKSWSVYSYEPNTHIFDESIKVYNQIVDNYGKFVLLNKAIMSYSGKMKFNSHRGAWTDHTKTNYIPGYTTGSNTLERNPLFDNGNGFYFDSIPIEIECDSITELIDDICANDENPEIYIKCDIEGSEFEVLPALLNSNNIDKVIEIYVEWHERFWHDDYYEYNEKVNQKKYIIDNLLQKKIIYNTHH